MVDITPGTQIGADGRRYPAGTQPTDAAPYVSQLVRVIGDPDEGDVPSWDEEAGAFRPAVGGAGGGTAADITFDDTGLLHTTGATVQEALASADAAIDAAAGGGLLAVTTTDGATVDFSGAGTAGSPLTAEVPDGSLGAVKFSFDVATQAELDAEAGTRAAADTALDGRLDTAETKLAFITVTQAVDLDTIESRVNDLDAAVVLRGSWDASTGSFPGGGTAQAGSSYIVSTGGTVDGVAFVANDRIVAITDNASTGTYAGNWLKLDYTDSVLSVDGRTGAVTLTDLYDAAGAAAAAQAAAVQRANHTGSQAISTITGLQTALDAKAPTANPTFTGNVVVPDADADTEALNRQTGDGRYAPKALTLNAQTGTTYTPVLADNQKLVTLSNAAAITVTMPQDSDVAFPVGTQIHFTQLGAGQVTFAAGTGATVNATPTAKTRAQYSTVTAVKRAANTWLLIGDLAAA